MSNFDAELTIAEIGAKGDGIAKLEGGKRVFVPFTAAGDRVRVRVGKSAAAGDSMQARLVEVLEPGPGRGKAVCKHFTVCGGCALQHLTPEAYDAWKLELVRAALDREGVENVALRPLLKSPPGSRRRADFTAVRRKDDVILGFNGRASNQVVDLLECPVTMPSIVALLPGLRALLMDVLPLAAHAEIVVNALTHGLDVLVTTTAELAKHHERLARFAREAGLVRLSRAHPKSRQGEIVVALRPATVRFGAVEIAVPPATFLQATREGEAALAKLVVEACAGSRRIADLYAGCGTFTFSLAGAAPKSVKLHAVEFDESMIDSLRAAARAAMLPNVGVELRNLDRKPLATNELNHYDAVVFDPPRAGARAQAEALAQSRVSTVVAVSCNPVSFARDALILIEGGYWLEFVQPVDQFLWSPHLELVGVFHRGR